MGGGDGHPTYPCLNEVIKLPVFRLPCLQWRQKNKTNGIEANYLVPPTLLNMFTMSGMCGRCLLRHTRTYDIHGYQNTGNKLVLNICTSLWKALNVPLQTVMVPACVHKLLYVYVFLHCSLQCDTLYKLLSGI